MLSKLSIKIIFCVTLILFLHGALLVWYVVRSEKAIFLKLAYSKAEDLNRRTYNSLISRMARGIKSENDIRNWLDEIRLVEGVGDVLELRLIHLTDFKKTLIGGEMSGKPSVSEGGYQSELEKKVLSDENHEFRGEVEIDLQGKKHRAIKFISPIKAEMRCLSCHHIRKDGVIAAFSSIISLEEIYVALQERKLENTLLFSLASIFSLTLLYFFLRKIVVTPLQDISKASQFVAKEGELSFKVETKSMDEIGELADSFNKMVENLSKTLVSKSFVENIITFIPDALIVVNPDATIRVVNHVTEKLLGYQENELVGKPISIIFFEKETLFHETITNHQAEEADFIRNSDLTFITKSNEKVPVSFNSSVMRDNDGKNLCVIGVAKDIREIKRLMQREMDFASAAAEKQKRQELDALNQQLMASELKLRAINQSLEERVNERTQELIKVNSDLRNTQDQIIQQERLKALGTMASGIAHDFNNALSPILGFTEMLLFSPDILNERETAIMYLKAIKTAGDDAAHIVQRLRELYRHREKTDLLAKINLGQLIPQVGVLTQPRWKDQTQALGLQIQLSIDVEEPSEIIG
ncbi:PAS domain S-box protein, partial [bacterium]|nr:PAS domain S-box protein [bacterium]